MVDLIHEQKNQLFYNLFSPDLWNRLVFVELETRQRDPDKWAK